MRRIACLCVVLLLPLLSLAADKDDPNKKDLDAMQGDWAGDKMTRGGFAMSDDDAGALFRTVKGEGYTLSRFRKKVGSGIFKLDASKDPKEIDIVADGPKKVTIKGIYKIDKDTMTMCYGAPTEERPKAFESKEGTGTTLIVWKREKK